MICAASFLDNLYDFLLSSSEQRQWLLDRFQWDLCTTTHHTSAKIDLFFSKPVSTSAPRFPLLLVFLFFFYIDVLDWKCSEALHPRLFGPARGGLAVDVGEAGEMLRVFVLRVPARAQRGVHVPGGGVAGRMHRRAGVTAVSRGHIWPPGGNRCGVQPRSAAHQARLHPGHLAVELVLQEERQRTEMNKQNEQT